MRSLTVGKQSPRVVSGPMAQLVRAWRDGLRRRRAQEEAQAALRGLNTRELRDIGFARDARGAGLAGQEDAVAQAALMMGGNAAGRL